MTTECDRCFQRGTILYNGEVIPCPSCGGKMLKGKRVAIVRAALRYLIEADPRFKSGAISVTKVTEDWCRAEIEIRPKWGAWEDFKKKGDGEVEHSEMNDQERRVREICESMADSGVVSKLAWEHGSEDIIFQMLSIIAAHNLILVPPDDPRAEDKTQMLADAMYENKDLKLRLEQAEEQIKMMRGAAVEARQVLLRSSQVTK